jgi:hypothetical protein
LYLRRGTAVTLSKSTVFTSPLAFLNLFDDVSGVYVFAREKVVLHLGGRAAFARKSASVFHFSLIFAFVFALVSADANRRVFSAAYSS